MADIFLSYNRQDQAAADHFVQGFESAGLSVWWDRQLRAGEAYDEVTENALRDARAVVVLWSEKAVASRWVRAEATLAQRFGTFVPCMIEPCERPIMFELTQTEDLSHWSGESDDPTWRSFVAHVRDVAVGAESSAQGAAIPSASSKPVPMRRPSSERRQITFVSACLNDGDRIASATDPEDWHEFLDELQAACKPCIERYAGRAAWKGHCLTVTFGYPTAMEDAAERAVRMAQEILQAAASLKLPADAGQSTACALKIGINSSLTLVSVRNGECELVGDGASVAEGARDLAPPGAIVATDTIRALASNAFHLAAFDGDSHGQKLYRVTDAASADSGAQGWETGALTGFVGREDEYEHICRRWERSRDAEGQYVLIRGEPGIGKSRLVDHFREQIRDCDHMWFMLQGSSLFPNTPYYALTQTIRQAIEGMDGEPSDALSNLLQQTGLPEHLMPLLAPVIGLGSPADESGVPAGDAQRSQLLSDLANAVFELTERQPVVLFLDDLQWFDPSTLELVQMLVEQGDSERLMVLGTARKEFEQPWAERDHHSRINLSRLPKSAVDNLIKEVFGDEKIDDHTRRAILDKADGVPLFAEELAKLAARDGAATDATLPLTLRSLLAARMDRLGPARELLQTCSVLGNCSYAFLEAITDLSPRDLDAQLKHLTEEQLLDVRGAPPHSNYKFKHALLRDGAYETMTRKRRRQLHEDAANKIVDQFPDMAKREMELVANHWTQAANYEKAVTAWLDLGKKDFLRGANQEAAAHLRRGLELIGTLPEGQDRDRQEMELWSELNNALQQSLGYSNPQTIEAANRATDLAKELGVLSKVIIGQVQLWRGTVTAGNYNEADEVADRINALAESLGDEEQLDWMPFFSLNALVQTAYYNGRLNEFEQPFAELEGLFGKNEGMFSVNDDVVALGVGALAAWAMGRSPLARQRIDHAIEISEQSKQPYAIAVAHHFAGTVMAFDRDLVAARQHSERALKVSDENGIEFIGHLVRAKIGWLSKDAAPTTEEVAAMRQILDAMVAVNGRVGLVINMNRLAMALESRGEIEEASKAITEALEANPQERVVRPESLEIKARLDMQMGRRDAAETGFVEAIALAQDIGAKAFVLSASIQLANLLDSDGRREEALSALQTAIDNCGPEIDTPALGDARSLQTRLSHAEA